MANLNCCRKCDLEIKEQEIDQAEGFVQEAIKQHLELAKFSVRFCKLCQQSDCQHAEDHTISCANFSDTPKTS